MKEESMLDLNRLFEDREVCLTRTARCMKVLAHPDRMKILWLLHFGEKSVNDLVNFTNIKQTTLSQHLSLLKDRELVESRRQGSYVYYRLLNPKVLEIFAMIHNLYCDVEEVSGMDVHDEYQNISYSEQHT